MPLCARTTRSSVGSPMIDAARQRARAGEGLGEPARAEGADLLVVGEEQRPAGARSAGRVDRGEAVGGQRQESLHVGGAAPDQPVARVGQRERVGLASRVSSAGTTSMCPESTRPSRSSDWGPTATTRLVLEPSADGVPGDADAGSVEVVCEEVGQRQVAQTAGRVEADEAREERSIVEGRGRGGDAPQPRRRHRVPPAPPSRRRPGSLRRPARRRARAAPAG